LEDKDNALPMLKEAETIRNNAVKAENEVLEIVEKKLAGSSNKN
jgi:hypothetical protein